MAELTRAERQLEDTCIPFAFPGMPRIHCLFTTRHTGSLSLQGALDTDSAAKRKALLQQLQLEHWSELHQVHGDAFLPHPSPTSLNEAQLHHIARHADGQCTSQPGLALVIKTADCQPVLLAHKDGHVAALHVGWRGNVLNFPQTGVAAFCKACGIEPGDIMAVRGPSLGWAQFTNFDREWPKEFTPWFDASRQCVDLWELTRHQLQEAGVPAQHIFTLDLCTYSLSKMFFSHRQRDTGRQAALIWSCKEALSSV